MMARNKYRAVKTEFNGTVYDSKGEANLAMGIEAMLRNGEIVGYQQQVKLPLRGRNGKVVGTHKVDFLLIYPDRHCEIWEYKGYRVRDFAIRKKLCEDNYPGLKYVVHSK